MAERGSSVVYERKRFTEAHSGESFARGESRNSIKLN